MDSTNRQNTNLPEHSITVEKLPSLSLPYPENCTITYFTYSYGEVVKTSASVFQTKEALELIVSGIACSFPKNNLTVGDILYLGLMRKVSTLGSEEIQAPYRCSKCEKLSYLIFKNTDFDFNELKVPSLPLNLKLESTGKTYELFPLTLGKYLDLVSKKKNNDELALKAALCVNLPFEEVYNDWNNCRNHDDMLALNEADELLDHSLKPIEAVCSNKLSDDSACGNKTMIRLEAKQSLLLPFRKSGKSTKHRISYGKTSEPESDSHGSNGLPEGEAIK